MKLGALLVLLGRRGLVYKVSKSGDYPYILDPRSGRIFPLPSISASEEVEPELLEWISNLSGLALDLDLLQDQQDEEP